MGRCCFFGRSRPLLGLLHPTSQEADWSDAEGWAHCGFDVTAVDISPSACKQVVVWNSMS